MARSGTGIRRRLDFEYHNDAEEIVVAPCDRLEPLACRLSRRTILVPEDRQASW